MTLIETIPPRRLATRRPARRPGPVRPGGAPVRYRGTGVAMSSAPHRGRPVTPLTTVALGLLAALITVCLGMVAHVGQTVTGASDRLPDRLAVVRVDAGENLQHLAARVAPGAPVRQVAQRIRELNALDSATLAAGQTLIVPVG